MAQYELSSQLVKFLDRHLVFPLLEFLQSRDVYNEGDILKSKIALLQRTNMVDFAMDIHKLLYDTDDVPEDMKERRSEVVARLRKLQTDVEPISQILANPNVTRSFRAEKHFNIQYLQEQYSMGPENIEALYQYAKFQFDCGNYSLASELLTYYQWLCTNGERTMSAMWGKLGAYILLQMWDNATADLHKLKEALDGSFGEKPLVLLQQRTWLLHWSLFVFWNHENGRNALVDLFFQAPYLNAIQTNAQHLLRYLATAVVINKRKRSHLKELIKVIQQEAYQYSDPITQFLVCLFVDYDFDGAQQKLKECEVVIENDYFLAGVKDEFVEEARLYIFENYCHIHQCIDIQMLADRLNLDLPSAEKWITNLILNAKINAKIDAKTATVVMGKQTQSAQEQLIERAKQLSVRTFALANQVVGTAVAKA